MIDQLIVPLHGRHGNAQVRRDELETKKAE